MARYTEGESERNWKRSARGAGQRRLLAEIRPMLRVARARLVNYRFLAYRALFWVDVFFFVCVWLARIKWRNKRIGNPRDALVMEIWIIEIQIVYISILYT